METLLAALAAQPDSVPAGREAKVSAARCAGHPGAARGGRAQAARPRPAVGLRRPTRPVRAAGEQRVGAACGGAG